MGFQRPEAVFSLTFIAMLWVRARLPFKVLLLIRLINSNKQIGSNRRFPGS
jgi:hypothetical protein